MKDTRRPDSHERSRDRRNRPGRRGHDLRLVRSPRRARAAQDRRGRVGARQLRDASGHRRSRHPCRSRGVDAGRREGRLRGGPRRARLGRRGRTRRTPQGRIPEAVGGHKNQPVAGGGADRARDGGLDALAPPPRMGELGPVRPLYARHLRRGTGLLRRGGEGPSARQHDDGHPHRHGQRRGVGVFDLCSRRVSGARGPSEPPHLLRDGRRHRHADPARSLPGGQSQDPDVRFDPSPDAAGSRRGDRHRVGWRSALPARWSTQEGHAPACAARRDRPHRRRGRRRRVVRQRGDGHRRALARGEGGRRRRDRRHAQRARFLRFQGRTRGQRDDVGRHRAHGPASPRLQGPDAGLGRPRLEHLRSHRDRPRRADGSCVRSGRLGMGCRLDGRCGGPRHRVSVCARVGDAHGFDGGHRPRRRAWHPHQGWRGAGARGAREVGAVGQDGHAHRRPSASPGGSRVGRGVRIRCVGLRRSRGSAERAPCRTGHRGRSRPTRRRAARGNRVRQRTRPGRLGGRRRDPGAFGPYRVGVGWRARRRRVAGCRRDGGGQRVAPGGGRATSAVRCGRRGFAHQPRSRA